MKDTFDQVGGKEEISSFRTSKLEPETYYSVFQRTYKKCVSDENMHSISLVHVEKISGIFCMCIVVKLVVIMQRFIILYVVIGLVIELRVYFIL